MCLGLRPSAINVIAQRAAAGRRFENEGAIPYRAEQPLTVFQLPKGHQVRLCTTNNLEKYHQEIKRRTSEGHCATAGMAIRHPKSCALETY